MNSRALFVDVSLNPLLRLGVGGYLVVPTSLLEVSPHNIKGSEVANRLAVRQFEGTSSSKLEVQTVLWALENYRITQKNATPGKLKIYSDSQCVAGLAGRRPDLEAKNFLSKTTKLLLKNAALYRRFYELQDELGFEVVKVAGHGRSCSHDAAQRIFSFVDKGVRTALKLWMDEFETKSVETGR